MKLIWASDARCIFADVAAGVPQEELNRCAAGPGFRAENIVARPAWHGSTADRAIVAKLPQPGVGEIPAPAMVPQLSIRRAYCYCLISGGIIGGFFGCYRTEKIVEVTRLRCLYVAGQKGWPRAIFAGDSSRPPQRGCGSRCLPYGEVVEAQIPCGSAGSLHCQQRCAPGSKRYLRDYPPITNRRRRLPVSNQKFDRSLRTGGQRKPTRLMLIGESI